MMLGSLTEGLLHRVYKFRFCSQSNRKSKGERHFQKQLIFSGVSDRSAADGKKGIKGVLSCTKEGAQV